MRKKKKKKTYQISWFEISKDIWFIIIQHHSVYFDLKPFEAVTYSEMNLSIPKCIAPAFKHIHNCSRMHPFPMCIVLMYCTRFHPYSMCSCIPHAFPHITCVHIMHMYSPISHVLCVHVLHTLSPKSYVSIIILHTLSSTLCAICPCIAHAFTPISFVLVKEHTHTHTVLTISLRHSL